jgi:hypothetical protein
MREVSKPEDFRHQFLGTLNNGGLMGLIGPITFILNMIYERRA